MFKVIVFLCLSLSFAKATDEDIPRFRHNWLLRKHGMAGSPWSEVFPHVEHHKQRAAYDEKDNISTMRDVFNLLGEDQDREELITPAYGSEVLSYGDDAKNYKVGLPLPQKPKDGEATNLMCYVPTRRGMIVTHCGLADTLQMLTSTSTSLSPPKTKMSVQIPINVYEKGIFRIHSVDKRELATAEDDEGTCPTTKSCGFVIPHFWSLPKLCLSDFDCPYEQKCCSHSCYQHKVCQHPISENTEATVNHINIKQFINLNINKETPENIESLLNGTNIDESLWNLTTSNSSDYNLTVSYSHEISRKLPLNLTAANSSSDELATNSTSDELTTNSTSDELTTNSSSDELAINSTSDELATISTSEPTTNSSGSEHEQTLNLTISNSTQEHSLPWNLTLTNNSKEYEPISNLTFNSSKEHDLDVLHFHILPKANPFDPDAEIDEIEDTSGSGSGDDSL